MSRRGWVLFSVMCLVWGIPYLLIKVAVEAMSPAFLVLVRTGLSALILIPIAMWRGDLAPLVRRWRIVLLYTTVEVAVPWFLLSDAETRISSSLAGLLIAAVPLVGVVISLPTAGRERVGPVRVAGLLCGVVGVGLLLGFDVHAGDLRAVGEMAVVTVCYTVGPMLIARRLPDLPATGVITASLGLTALVYLPLGLSRLPASLPSLRVDAAVAVLGVVCTAAGFLVFFALIAEVGPIRAMVFTYVNPAVAVALGVLLLGEPFTGGTAAGFVLILCGCGLATQGDRLRRGPRVPSAGSAEAAAGAVLPRPRPAVER